MSSVLPGVSSLQLDQAVFFEPTLDAVVVEWQPDQLGSFPLVLEYILQLMQLHRTGKILAKVSSLTLSPNQQLDWFTQDWLPRALRAGYKAFAAVGPVPLLSELIISPSASQVQGQGVKVSFFKTLPEAQEWLRGIA
jgi:hypothetical protein